MKQTLSDKIKCKIRMAIYKIIKHKFSCCDEFRNCDKCLAEVSGHPERWIEIKERIKNNGGN